MFQQWRGRRPDRNFNKYFQNKLVSFFLNGVLINFIFRKSDTNQIEPVNVRVEPAENDSGDENRRAKQIADQNRANPNVTTP